MIFRHRPTLSRVVGSWVNNIVWYATVSFSYASLVRLPFHYNIIARRIRNAKLRFTYLKHNECVPYYKQYIAVFDYPVT